MVIAIFMDKKASFQIGKIHLINFLIIRNLNSLKKMRKFAKLITLTNKK